jgi:hypothetical protein
MIVITICYPFFIVFVLKVNMKNLDNENIQNTIGTLYEDIDI